MEILSSNVYVGPNLYARFPVIRLVIDLGALEKWPSARLGSAFRDGLVAALPGLADHTCSYGEPGGFVRRLQEGDGTWLGHIWEHVAIELQASAGVDVSFGKTRSRDTEGVYDLVYAYLNRDVGLEAADVGRRLLVHLLPGAAADEAGLARDPGFDWETEHDAFIRFAQRRELGPSTGALVRAAEERDIPWLRLNRYSLVQFGHGVHQQRIQATITSETTHIAVAISQDKEETHGILRDLGLPVPRQIVVRSAERALAAARRLGHPVVVKPLDGNHGRGVAINLTTDDDVAAAFARALEQARGASVVVEQHIAGFDHRMLVVGGELVAVAKRVPGHVVGDGTHTVEQLVDIVNADPRRGVGHEKVLTRLEFDHQANEALAAAGYDRGTVLDDGEVLYLRTTANLSTGGTATDVTDVVHPDNQFMAERAVKAVGLDVGGVDFLTTDISRSFKDVGGAIVEVNAAPGFRMHVSPSEGAPRDVAGPVMDMLFPPTRPSRIPIAAITGTNGKTTTTRMVAHLLRGSGHTVGMTTTDGVHIGGRLTVKGDMTGPTSARMVLRDPAPTAAVLETARGGMLRAGLGFRRCDVGAVLNIAADHLGSKGVETLDQLAEVKRLVVEVATGTAVLNADDDRCLEMANHTDAETICYVSLQEEHPLVREHVRAGGRAVVLESGINGEMITILDRGRHVPLVWTHLVPATLEGRATHNVQNAMFAAAIAYSLDVDLEQIRDGLRTFDASFFQTPGRTNLFHEHPFRVLLDYAHNPAAVEAICRTMDRFDVSGRRIAVLTAPGDRRDADIRDTARIAADSFDHFVLRADDDRRGREHDEVPRMQRDELRALGVPDAAIDVIPDEQAAVDHALRMAGEGDFVTIFADNTTRSWKQVVHFDREDAPPGPATPPARPADAADAADPDAADPDAADPDAADPDAADDDDHATLGDAMDDLADDLDEHSFVLGRRRLVRDDRGVRVVADRDD